MKRVTVARGIAGLFLLANLAPPALACSAPASNLPAASIVTALATSGLIACYPTSGTFQNQEILSGGASGSITDYKLGASTIDPTKVVGTYDIGTIQTDAITYT